MNILGIDIGGTKCAVVLGDEAGNIKDKISFATTDVNSTLGNITQSIRKLSEKTKIDCCGISCGGPLDEKRGIILSPPNLPGWDEIHITEIVSKEAGAPCFLRNDANACAVAEHRFGAGKGADNMIFLTFGTGLGAGIIADGRLISGACGLAGEVGHIRLSDKGPEGYGKEGSFEGFCSGAGLARLGRIVAAKYEKSGIAVPWKDSFDVATMADWARKGEPAAKEVFTVSAEKLGYGLSILIDIFNPERIIIGSVYARCTDLFEEPMKKIIEKEALALSCSKCEILPALLGESIGDMAALAVGAQGIQNETY